MHKGSGRDEGNRSRQLWDFLERSTVLKKRLRIGHGEKRSVGSGLESGCHLSWEMERRNGRFLAGFWLGYENEVLRLKI